MINALRQALCLAAALVLFTGCSVYSKVGEKKTKDITVTSEQGDLAARAKDLKGDPMARLGLYLDAANAARLKLIEKPANTLIRSDYNFAVGRIAEMIRDDNLKPWDAPVVAQSNVGGRWSFTLEPPDPRPEYHPRNFTILPSDRYDFKGKMVGVRTVKQGLGAPVVVSAKDMDYTKIDQFAQGKQVYYGLTALIQFGEGDKCKMLLVDPLNSETVTLDGNDYQVAADFQAPLALALAELSPRKSELAGFFNPSDDPDLARLARLQPYNPNKIPIVCIHGLGDSDATWMPLIETLRGDEQIRENYQFWYFSYPTGLPYPTSAAILRQQLTQFSETYPNHKDLVLIGHSMGGMISRLLITDAGTSLWDIYYDRPPEELNFSDDTREVLSRTLIFDAQPRLSRVIFASPSHRGSKSAVGFLGRWGARLIGNPFNDETIGEEAVSNMRPELRATGEHRLPNSVEMLDPGNRFLEEIDKLPTKDGIPFHTIIGDEGKGGNLDHTEPESSDGVVPYWSSHMDGAASETVIPSDHWSIRHPLGIAEVKRILLLHLRNQ